MELTTSQDILVRGLQKIQGIVERRNTLPILSHFLLAAQADGVVIHATDLELGYKGHLDATVNKPGTITLPARKTYDILRELSAGAEVNLALANHGWVRITAGSASFRVPCLPAEEYPSLPRIEDGDFFSLDGGIVEEMIRKTIFATSHDETRYTLSGVLMVSDGSTLTMVATDGHRLAYTSNAVPVGKSFRFIVPRKALEEVNRFAADSDERDIALAVLENHLVFRKGQSVLITRLIEGQFPDYEGVIPKEFSRRVTVDHERLLRALRRVSLLSNEKTKPVKIDFESNSMTLRSNTPEMGEAMEQIPAEYTSESMVMGFNARYMLEALAVITSEHINLELNDPLSPGVLRPADQSQFFYVIMPMRV